KVSRRFVLPAFGLPHRNSALARPDRRHSATGSALSRKICFPTARAGIVRGGARTAKNAALGWEHSRAAERDRTRSDPLGRATGDSPRAPVAGGCKPWQLSLELVWGRGVDLSSAEGRGAPALFGKQSHF